MLRLGHYVCFASLFILTLTDHSGQDARFYGRRGDYRFLNLGEAAEALEWYWRAVQAGVASSDLDSESRNLNNAGACQLTLFRYHDAEQTLLRARRLAETAHQDELLAGADSNLAAVYVQLDDFPRAGMYAREAIEAYSRAGKPKQRLRAFLVLADILSRQQLIRQGETFYLCGIRAATSLAEWLSASTGWLHYGKALLENGQLEDARNAFAESRRCLSRSGSRSGEDALLWNLSRLRLRRNDTDGALRDINAAFKAAETANRIPPWRFSQTRAAIELAKGDAVGALRDARTARRRAKETRADVIPDNESRVGAEGLQDEIFSVLIDAGNQVYLKTRDPALVRETFEAVEENRAESLQALRPTTSNWRAHLPSPQYWDKLSELVTAERLAVRFHSSETNARLDRLRGELSEMEESAKTAVDGHVGTVLDRVKKNLPADAALLSFRLGNRASWLWMVQHGELRLCELPSKAVLLGEIETFEDSVQRDDTDRIAKTGHRLYGHLFGEPDSSPGSSSQWFISADEPLNTVPIAALVVKVDKSGPVYLTQRKTLEIIPGAQLFEYPVSDRLTNKRFVAAGDGIYNRADPRYGGAGLLRPASWSMARLPASGAEVRFAATLWRNAKLLTGAGLTREALIREIDRDPDVIHIASHVISGRDRWRAGILALGMDGAGEPYLLTPQEILMHPIHTRLVVMTGCSSGSGDSLPASGLMGLTRAWLAAGAGEVLATRWPTKDEDSDGLVGNFYVHLLASADGNIPQALQEAREEMIARGGWRAEPRYWSSFFLIGVR